MRFFFTKERVMNVSTGQKYHINAALVDTQCSCFISKTEILFHTNEKIVQLQENQMAKNSNIAETSSGLIMLSPALGTNHISADFLFDDLNFASRYNATSRTSTSSRMQSKI